MKKIVILTTMILMAGIMQAQVVDTITPEQQQKQQEAIHKQQEYERQQAEAQQAAKAKEDADKALRQAEKEQAKADKAAAKEQEEARKAEKAAKRAERRAEIGRGTRFFIDPYASVLTTSRVFHRSDIANASVGFNFGGNIEISYPLSKHWDVTAGLGYRRTMLLYRNHIDYDGSTFVAEDNDSIDWTSRRSTLNINTIMVPIHLTHVKNGESNWYIGIDLGFNLANNSFMIKEVKDDKYADITNQNQLSIVNKWRAEVTFGWASKTRFLVFQPNLSIHYNLLPTYTCEGNKYHEFGLTFHL